MEIRQNIITTLTDWAEQGIPGSDWGLDTPNDLAEDLKEKKEKCKK
ncbi:MAG: hypothetical protein PHP01_08885 [Phycisphaerae bacterium]|nr:hypothetical protein [Phycisphaerae bacterium]